jgi:DNA-directed RNA polymerase specialized sigma24 family protein
VLSKARDAADDLVQATHLRAMERMDQFARERALTGLVAILLLIWLTRCDRNEFGKVAVSSTRRIR